jgi:hypothetical protein
MSQQALMQVLEKASTDAAFRDELKKNPETALKAYDLTAEEKAALMSGDTTQLESMGVDSRISKFGGSTYFDSENANSFASGD